MEVNILTSSETVFGNLETIMFYNTKINQKLL